MIRSRFRKYIGAAADSNIYVRRIIIWQKKRRYCTVECRQQVILRLVIISERFVTG